MQINLAALLLALSLNELIHVLAEVLGMQGKLKRLSTYMAGKPYTEMKISIDTRAKSHAISIGMFIIIVGLAYFGLSLTSMSLELSAVLSCIALVLSYVIMFLMVHDYHVSIERITRPFMNKQK